MVQVMGKSYNRHSDLQQANLISALPLFEDAAGAVPVLPGRPVTIADYGSAQGRSSLVPIASAIDHVRRRAGFDGEICVVHIDLPANDFTALFTLLADDASSYLRRGGPIHPMAIGRSYFDTLLPRGSVTLGWSSNALQWLSGNPVEVDDHGWAVFSRDPAARAAVSARLDLDWRRFLAARAVELVPGGRLVCQFLAHGPEAHGFEWMAGLFWASILEVAERGRLTQAELRRMTSPAAGRTVAQIEAPFAEGLVPGLALRELALVEAPDPYWAAYQETGDSRAFGLQWANMMKAANGPTFIAALDPGRDRDSFLDEVTETLAGRVAAEPRKSQSFNALVVIERLDEPERKR